MGLYIMKGSKASTDELPFGNKSVNQPAKAERRNKSLKTHLHLLLLQPISHHHQQNLYIVWQWTFIVCYSRC